MKNYLHGVCVLQRAHQSTVLGSIRPDGIIRTQSSEVCQRVYMLIDRIARTNNFLIKPFPVQVRKCNCPSSTCESPEFRGSPSAPAVNSWLSKAIIKNIPVSDFMVWTVHTVAYTSRLYWDRPTCVRPTVSVNICFILRHARPSSFRSPLPFQKIEKYPNSQTHAYPRWC